jgi:hypothetical protein
MGTNGDKAGDEGRAAKLPATGTYPADLLLLPAWLDLLHLDPDRECFSQGLDQLAEINPLIGK